MELKRELLVTLGALVVLNLLLAFGCVALFVRMGPAIQRILQDNVASIMSAEEILVELAHAGTAPLSIDARQRVDDSLSEARVHMTSPAERALLQALEQELPPAMGGQPQAVVQAINTVRQLIALHRGAMRGVDQEARRLGSAGAWAAVFIGFLSFLLSLSVVVRLQKRVLQPLVDLHAVLESARKGDRLRRCRMSDAPKEVTQVTQSVNKLLDERLARDLS